MNLETLGNLRSRQFKIKESTAATDKVRGEQSANQHADTVDQQCHNGTCEITWKPAPAVKPSQAANAS